MKIKPSLPIGLGLSLALAGCLFDKEANRGSVVDNELRVGKLFLADGRPAVNARVRLYPVRHVPDSSSPVFSTRTDAKGSFAVDSVSSEMYNILGDLDGEFSFQDSVFISGSTKSIPADTLDAPGSIIGVVGLQPGDDPRTVTVQALGTNSFSNVDVSGHFRLANLGAGKYTTRILTTLPEYTPLFSELTVRVGRNDTLRDTLRILFTGIPAVTDIKAEMDTVNGVARITWRPVNFPSFGGYSVYRDPVGTLDFAKAPINTLRLTDTIFLDTLYRPSGDTLPRNWEYRVDVQNLNKKPGKMFHVAVLAAVPPKTAQTRFKFKLLGTHGDTASIRDTVKVIAIFENPAYANKRIVWMEAGKTDTLRTAVPDVKSGSDTLKWITPDSAGDRTIQVQATDAAGRTWRDSLRLTTVLDRPLANAGNDSIVGYGTAFTLHGRGSDGFGSIVKWEWLIGSAREFTETKSGDDVITLPMDADSAFICMLRVTDDDGFTSIDTVKLDIRRSRVVGHLATPQVLTRNLIVASYVMGGKIISILDSMGSITLESFDTLSGKSTVLSRHHLEGFDRTSALVGSKVYLSGSYSISRDPIPGSMSSYDFDTGVWETELTWPATNTFPQSDSVPRVDSKIIAFGNRLFCFSKNGIFEYDLSRKIWVFKTKVEANLYGSVFSGGDGRIYAMNSTVFGAFDPVSNVWTPLKAPALRVKPGLGWMDGKLYVLGGEWTAGRFSEGATDAVMEYDPANDSWILKSPLIHATGHPGVVILGDRIYVVGASSLSLDDPPTEAKGIHVLNAVEAYKP
jgi:hypothetical protein